ncbi:MAG: hypothetical protein HYX53_18020 [Chloroflexi bacterium]|nr:hypothetical protein [Chloroflexota bacterium]
MTVFIEAIHTIRPITNTAFDRYVELYGNVVMPLLKRFESMAAYEQASASLFREPTLLSSFAALAKEFSVTESAKSARPVPYATEQRLERALAGRPATPRQYVQAILHLAPGGQAVAYGLIGRLADQFEAAGVQLATAYETAIGQRGEVTDIWIAPAAPSFAYQPGDPMAEITSALRKAAPEESMYFLNPLPYSPLQ